MRKQNAKHFRILVLGKFPILKVELIYSSITPYLRHPNSYGAASIFSLRYFSTFNSFAAVNPNPYLTPTMPQFQLQLSEETKVSRAHPPLPPPSLLPLSLLLLTNTDPRRSAPPNPLPVIIMTIIITITTTSLTYASPIGAHNPNPRHLPSNPALRIPTPDPLSWYDGSPPTCSLTP